MASPDDPKLDAFSVALVASSAWLGPTLAPLVAAYGLIVVGWFAGALIGLFVRRQNTAPTVVYLLLTFIFSVGVTGGLAMLAAEYMAMRADVLLLPIAAALAAFPDRMVALLGGLWESVTATLTKGRAK